MTTSFKLVPSEDYDCGTMTVDLVGLIRGEGGALWLFGHERQLLKFALETFGESLRKHRMWLKHMRLDYNMETQEHEFNRLIRDAIYTALYAEATYEKFIASRWYVDRIKLSIPKRCTLAKLLESIPRKG
jgi:hypothetical protein